MTFAAALDAPITTAPPAGGLYRNVWRYAAGARLAMLGSIALLVASQVLKLAVPWFAGQAISALLRGDHQGLIDAALWVVGVLGVNVGVWAMHGPGRVLERTVGVRVRQGINDALYDKLCRAPLAWHDRHHSGDVQHRMSQSSQALYTFAQSQFVYLQSIVSFIGPIVALSLLSALTGSVAVVGYLAVAFVILRFDGALMGLARDENAAERRFTSGLLDFVGNMSTLMSLRLQPSTRRLLQRRLDNVFKPLKRSIVLNEIRWCAVDLMSAALTWGLVAAFVWQSLHSGKAAAALMGSVFMVYQYAQQAGGVVGAMASSFQTFTRARIDFASADIIWQAPEQPVATATVDADWQRIDLRDLCYEHGAVTSTTADGSAQVEATPTSDRGGLQHVSLSLHRGERIALVGPSGSGKSTLMRVLAGLYEPSRGHVDVDGMTRLGLRHLASASTLIPQEADVFEATVRENIAFDNACDDRSMRLALHTSAFDEVLKTMPQGLDTPISERGFNMSGGQRQRLCLARGVLAAADSSIVFLDEPTSALDSVTEARVHRRLDAAFPDACIVASVHRMSLLEHFDRVVLMVAGRVVDVGTVDDLRDRQPLFAQMLGGAESRAEHAEEADTDALLQAAVA